MDAAQFTAAVQGMQGLLPEMITHLVGLADKLTDKQRDDAAKELSAINDKLVSNMQEGVAIYQKGIEELDTILSKDIPELRKKAEKVQRSEESSSAEGLFGKS
ncbi:MAG: hypothetical protein PHI23_04075 [Candidatus Peribacteraceae bacterium]|nr:hypothetical protein [Candidatus Peribacteraceae bacterium]